MCFQEEKIIENKICRRRRYYFVIICFWGFLPLSNVEFEASLKQPHLNSNLFIYLVAIYLKSVYFGECCLFVRHPLAVYLPTLLAGRSQQQRLRENSTRIWLGCCMSDK